MWIPPSSDTKKERPVAGEEEVKDVVIPFPGEMRHLRRTPSSEEMGMMPRQLAKVERPRPHDPDYVLLHYDARLPRYKAQSDDEDNSNTASRNVRVLTRACSYEDLDEYTKSTVDEIEAKAKAMADKAKAKADSDNNKKESKPKKKVEKKKSSTPPKKTYSDANSYSVPSMFSAPSMFDKSKSRSAPVDEDETECMTDSSVSESSDFGNDNFNNDNFNIDSTSIFCYPASSTRRGGRKPAATGGKAAAAAVVDPKPEPYVAKKPERESAPSRPFLVVERANVDCEDRNFVPTRRPRRPYSIRECAECGAHATTIGEPELKISCGAGCGAYYCSVNCFKRRIERRQEDGCWLRQCWLHKKAAYCVMGDDAAFGVYPDLTVSRPDARALAASNPTPVEWRGERN